MKLFASDIDNTLIPQTEKINKKSLKILSKKLSQRDIKIVYVSGRYFESVLEKQESEFLPMPDFILSHVGTVLHKRKNKKWIKDRSYSNFISKSWKGKSQPYIRKILKDIKELEEQESEAQSKFKQSYYLNLKYNKKKVLEKIRKKLNEKNMNSRIVYSVDKIKKIGLVDILPLRAGKQGAILFLTKKLKISLDQVLYAGDSGNDLDALTMGCNAVLVGNARKEIKKLLSEEAELKKISDNIYISKKKYIEGILDGAKHFRFFEKD